MIYLGSVPLRNGMVWEEEHQYSGVIQEVRQTLGGRSHVYSRAGTGPMHITLATQPDQGHQTVEVVRLLEDMTRDPAGCYTLQLGLRSFDVYFRHFEPPVITTVPVIPRSVLLPDDLCVVTIKLVTYAP